MQKEKHIIFHFFALIGKINFVNTVVRAETAYSGSKIQTSKPLLAVTETHVIINGGNSPQNIFYLKYISHEKICV